MFRLGYKFLVSRKGWLLLLIMSISIALSCIISISIASESIKAGIKEQAYSDYGEHTLTLINPSESKKDLNNNQNVKRVGSVEIKGNIQINADYSATAGSFDRNSLEMGKIELLKGTYPDKNNEVAIESSYHSLIDKDWKIGEKKTLEINNTYLEVTLSGITNDYSAKWSDLSDSGYPNIIMSEKNNLETNSQNFLVQLTGGNGNITSMQEKASDFLLKRNGFSNDHLFYNGLKNYKDITILAFIFQIATLLAYFLSFYCLFYFFNINQQRKLTVLKVVGATNSKLIKLNTYQIIILLLGSSLLSLPLIYLLYKQIINNTFQISKLDKSNILYIILIAILYIAIIFCITLFSSSLSIKHIKYNSINSLLHEHHPKKSLKNITTSTHIKDFTVRKVLNQTLLNPLLSLIVVITLTLSLSIIIFSFYIEKESAGFWDTEIDYYLNSQESFSFEDQNNLTVLDEKGLTFPPNAVHKLDANPNIKYVEKNPFMVDVHPLLKEKQLNPSIEEWLSENNYQNTTYDGDYIIPNVKFVFVNENELLKLNPDLDFNDLQGKVILYNPLDNKDSDESALKGEKINFVQKQKDSSNNKTNTWELEILESYNKPFYIRMDEKNSLNLSYPEFVIVLTESTAIENGLFSGYNELSIYLENKIEKKDIIQIESQLSRLVALTPGSLYQKISTIIDDDKRISLFVGYLGKLIYASTAIMAIISISVIVFSKFKVTKHQWGIYLILGMKKKELYVLLLLEMIFYLTLSSLVSLVLFSFTLFVDNLYPYIYYVKYFCLSILFILFFIIIGWYAIKVTINRQSLYSLIREEE